MANGKWVKGKESALWFWPMAGLRPAIMLPVLVFVDVRSSFFQKHPKDWVIKSVATAPDAQKQGFLGESLEIVPIVRIAEVTRSDFVILRCGHISQKLRLAAELTLNQNGDAITGTLSFTHPQGGRVQVPISSGVVSRDAVTFSGQNQFPMGSLEITFHGKIAGASLTGTADMTSRSLLIEPQTNVGSLNLKKQ
jgi:hypothetical protein